MATLGEEWDEWAAVRDAQTRPAAFAGLYELYLPQVYGYLRARTTTDDEALDLAQQVFVQALAALPRYQSGKVPFIVWIMRIARNLVIDARRRHRSTLAWDSLPSALQPCARDGAEEIVVREEARAELRNLLMELDEGKRELLLLRFVAGLNVREIAATVGKSEAAIYKQISRSLHMLKERYHG